MNEGHGWLWASIVGLILSCVGSSWLHCETEKRIDALERRAAPHVDTKP